MTPMTPGMFLSAKTWEGRLANAGCMEDVHAASETRKAQQQFSAKHLGIGGTSCIPDDTRQIYSYAWDVVTRHHNTDLVEVDLGVRKRMRHRGL